MDFFLAAVWPRSSASPRRRSTGRSESRRRAWGASPSSRSCRRRSRSWPACGSWASAMPRSGCGRAEMLQRRWSSAEAFTFQSTPSLNSDYPLTVPRRGGGPGRKAAATADDQGEDWSQGGAAVPPAEIRHQPPAVTPGNGDRTGAVSGKRASRFPDRALPQRYRSSEQERSYSEGESETLRFI